MTLYYCVCCYYTAVSIMLPFSMPCLCTSSRLYTAGHIIGYGLFLTISQLRFRNTGYAVLETATR